MRLLTTADIPGAVRQQLLDAWQPLAELQEGSQVRHKTAELSSFVQIMGEALQWLSPLKVAATVFLSQLAKEAATEVYKNKARIAAALAAAAAAPLRRAAAALGRARSDSPQKPEIVVGLPIPDDYFGTALTFPVDTEEEIALLLAQFVVRVERIQQVIAGEVSDGHPPLGRVQVIPNGSGGFLLRWIDQKFEKHEQEIS